MTKATHYPHYDVWDQHTEWDEHTRKIVGKRRIPTVAQLFLSDEEAKQVQSLASVLIDDIRLEVLTYITQHVDESLNSPIGEDQRKVGLPEKKQLYRLGLQGITETSQQMFQSKFTALGKDQQIEVLSAIASGNASMTQSWVRVPQQDFFKKLLYDIVSAYYSHPMVWSDIGYGGPAYPRGYVRVEKDLVDPWEANRNGK